MIDRELASLFAGDALLQRWLSLAAGRVTYQGLPARICWLGYGDRARAGVAINALVRSGAVSAPIVIGRDHLDSGSVASPYRETEAMRNGSDAIADWPILNALLNTAAGATWVSVHHGGGVGMGHSIHAGMVVVADGSDSQPTGSSVCSQPIPAPVWSGMPTPATTKRPSSQPSRGSTFRASGGDVAAGEAHRDSRPRSTTEPAIQCGALGL